MVFEPFTNWWMSRKVSFEPDWRLDRAVPNSRISFFHGIPQNLSPLTSAVWSFNKWTNPKSDSILISPPSLPRPYSWLPNIATTGTSFDFSFRRAGAISCRNVAKLSTLLSKMSPRSSTMRASCSKAKSMASTNLCEKSDTRLSV